MRVLFFGTAEFAVPALLALAAAPEHELVGIVTQPSKPAGRGRVLTESAVAYVAHAIDNVPVLTPSTLKDAALVEQLRALRPDVIAVAAYGKMLPPAILTMAPHRCVNIHPSLLPKYRGAAPINWAIINGETVTGITTMFLVEAMDAGDMLLQIEVPIEPMETAKALHDRLHVLGADLLLRTLDGLTADTITPRPQDPAGVTFAPMLTKADGRIDWAQPSRTIINHIRGMHPWPGAFTQHHATRIKILRAALPDNGETATGAAPGTIVAVDRSIHVATGNGQVCLVELQLAGKSAMRSEEVLRGYVVKAGEQLT